MELRSAERRETNTHVGDPPDSLDPINPDTSGHAQRASAWRRLQEYFSGSHESEPEAPGTARSGADAGNKNRPLQTQAPSATRAPEQLLPVGRFSPSPGLIVDRTENSVVISGLMELYGPEASPSRAASIQHAINTTWTRTFDDGHAIACAIVVRYRAPGSSPTYATQIEAKKSLWPSNVSLWVHGREMTLNAKEDDAFTWAPAHEFGHIIGLKDRYSESIMSWVWGAFGGSRTSSAEPGYAGNLMADSGGTLNMQNVADVAAENEPSPCWIHDDDQVAAWVSAHSTVDIGKLSTNDKLQMIRTLQGGWVSARDMAAIGRICASASSHDEAEAIRRGVDLLLFTDLGQRTQMRVFLAKMP
jgi:hypothetical protein